MTGLEKRMRKLEKKQRESVLKVCGKDSSHTWMADIPFCPYCNLSSEARIYYDIKEKTK